MGVACRVMMMLELVGISFLILAVVGLWQIARSLGPQPVNLIDLQKPRDQLGELVRQRTSELEKLDRQHLLILNNVGEGIFELDRNGHTTFVNPAAANLLGWQVEALIGKSHRDFVGCVQTDQAECPESVHNCPICDVLADGATRHIADDVFHRHDGLCLPVSYTCTPIKIMGSVTGVVVTCRDITELRQAQRHQKKQAAELIAKNMELEAQRQQLRAQHEELMSMNAVLEDAKQAAEAASRAKSEFLANMSHEIRTPMTAILGFAETLLAPDVSDDEAKDAIGTIRRNGKHLLEVINDILDISKIEAGKLEIEHVRCSPFQIVSEVVMLMHPYADAKKLTLHAECEGMIPEAIRSDSRRLKQILLNLVGNAVKFTQEGGVRVILRMDSASACESMLQFDLVDTGIGMTTEHKQRLFQPFSQADNSTSRKFGGTGLGLAVSRRLAEVMGGCISIVESEPGRGSRFRFSIPTGPLDRVTMVDSADGDRLLSKPAMVSPISSTPKPLNCRVLLAEDGPDNQRLVMFVLKKAGAEVTIAENGQIAMDKALEATQTGTPFDVILMDMQMPVMDGYEATSRLRRMGYTKPIIALTAHAMATDRKKCIAAGCDDYMAKPVDRRQLIDLINTWIERGRTEEALATRAVSS